MNRWRCFKQLVDSVPVSPKAVESTVETFQYTKCLESKHLAGFGCNE